jgi:hypothetical protein
MANHEILAPDRPGRRSGIRRLTFRQPSSRPPRSNVDETGQLASGGMHDWSAIKDKLRRTVRRAPEVVINVQGSRRGREGDSASNENVLRYMMYISRQGRLLVTDEHRARIDGVDAIRATHGTWNLDMQRMRSRRGEALHPTFNIIFSMPAKTDPAGLLDAVQGFACEHFSGYQYVMALHTPETEPGRKKDKSPDHPHVHVILRAENENGDRIYIRKGNLRAWREGFAAQLRARGIDANATSRTERGKSLKTIRGAEWHIDKHYQEKRAKGDPAQPSRAKAARLRDAARELQEGSTEPKPWELAMAARRRDIMRDLSRNVARLRQEGDHELANQVERFMQEMPPLDTERRQMQRALIEQVQKRVKELGRERE